MSSNQIKDQIISRDHETQQLLSWQSSTPAKRLAWLEEALILAYKSGELPKASDR